MGMLYFRENKVENYTALGAMGRIQNARYEAAGRNCLHNETTPAAESERKPRRMIQILKNISQNGNEYEKSDSRVISIF